MPCAIVQILGQPKQQTRPKFARQRGRVVTYEEAAIKDWKKGAAIVARSQLPTDWTPLEGPVAAEVVCVYSGPNVIGWRWKTTAPDLDNLVKAALDAMNGVLYKDDRQIVALNATKLVSGDCRQGVYVHVKRQPRRSLPLGLARQICTHWSELEEPIR